MVWQRHQQSPSWKAGLDRRRARWIRSGGCRECKFGHQDHLRSAHGGGHGEWRGLGTWGSGTNCKNAIARRVEPLYVGNHAEFRRPPRRASLKRGPPAGHRGFGLPRWRSIRTRRSKTIQLPLGRAGLLAWARQASPASSTAFDRQDRAGVLACHLSTLPAALGHMQHSGNFSHHPEPVLCSNQSPAK